MKCPGCQTDLDNKVNFCPQCGARMAQKCPACNATIPYDSKYCNKCGAKLSFSSHHITDIGANNDKQADTLYHKGERRHITVVFSDLSNYTTLSETYDPEDVRQLLAKIIDRSTKIISAYEGHVERIIGDEILAIFGLPKTHEDEAVRAVKAAHEIHAEVMRIGASEKFFMDSPCTMHTGINSGLVIIDNLSPMGNHYGISGDTVNIASRLSDMAGPNEILVGRETYKQTYGHFGFQCKPAVQVKGKVGDIDIYAVEKAKLKPLINRRKSGLRAQLIGRKAEFAQLHAAVGRLHKKKGSFFTVIGEAGTGKSRLLYEFEKAYKDHDLQWIRGYAYAHTQATPYYPLINLLRNWLEIEDIQSANEVRTRIQSVTAELLGDTTDEIPIIENLYGLENEAIQNMSPEIWLNRLTSTIQRIFSALAQNKPTIYCIEDIHWSDTSALSMLRRIVSDFRYPAILICTVRPPFTLFAGHQLSATIPKHYEIRLRELSNSESQDLVESLLNAGTIPLQLIRFIRDRAAGNPFYLEELINALVDGRALSYHEGIWVLTREIKETDIPSSIHGVITARLDLLSQSARRVLQESAVIGRVFLYTLLKNISIYGTQLDGILNELEHSGLISARSLYPETEMMFKHTLIQEVCYSSLLRTERIQIHERIGLAMEKLFSNRLNEFYETMAMHFKHGQSFKKAIFYLNRSGNKALRRHALEESQRHFLHAKELAELRMPTTKESRELLVDVLNQWAFVYYYSGNFRDLQKLFDTHKPVIEELSDHGRQGMYWAWQGWILWHRGQFETAYHNMRKAFDLGQSANALHVVAHACTWLAWSCADTGRLDEAVSFGDRAIELYENGLTQDPYIYFNALAGKGYACWHRGERKNTVAIGDRLINFGNSNTNVRSLVLGLCCKGWSHLITGDVNLAQSFFNEAVSVSEDPWYDRFPKLALCYGFTAAGETGQAGPLLQELVDFSLANGVEFLGTTARFFQELNHMNPSNAVQKLDFLEGQLEEWRQTNSWLRHLICGHLMASGFIRLSQQSAETNTRLQKNWQAYAIDKARIWYNVCIGCANDKGAVLLHALSCLGLAESFAISGETEQIKKPLTTALELLEKCEADQYLLKARKLQKESE